MEEASWCILNISGGDFGCCEALMQNGVLDVVVELIYSQTPVLKEHGLWILSNLAADSDNIKLVLRENKFI